MADYDVNLSDVQESIRFLQAFLETKQPDVDWTPGGPDHEVTIKGQSFPVALLRKAIETVRKENSLLSLRDLPASTDVDDMADAILANLLISRAPGRFTRGPVTCKFSRQVDQRVPRNARFFKGTALVYYPDYATDLILGASDLRPVLGPDGRVLHYAGTVNVVAARTGGAYDADAGPFDAVDPFSPYFLGAENPNRLTGGLDVQTTSDLIETAAGALSTRSLGNERANGTVLTNTLGVERTVTVGHGDPEMVRDVLETSNGRLHLGGACDLYVRMPVRTVTVRKTVGAAFQRPDGRAAVFRDTAPPSGFSFPVSGVRVGDVLYIKSGIPEAPIQYTIRAVRNYEVEVSLRTPFSVATDENVSSTIDYSIGRNYPDFDNRLSTAGTPSSSAETSRAVSAANRVMLDGGPVYAITKVELLPTSPAALASYRDPITGRVAFPVRSNTALLAPASTAISLPYRVEVLNPSESQSPRAVTQVEVGWPAVSLDGLDVEVTYETLAGFDAVGSFVIGENRPDPADYLARALHPVYVSFAVPYALRTDTSASARVGRLLVPQPNFDPAGAAAAIAKYVNEYRAADPIDVSSLVTQVRFAQGASVATLYAFSVSYELLAPDGRVFRYQTTDKVTLFPPDASSGASLLNPVELGLPATNYYDALRQTLRALGVSDRTVRFIAATAGITFEAR